MSKKDKYGSGSGTVSAQGWIDNSGFSSKAIKLPAGRKFFNTKKEGTYEFNIVPYRVKTKTAKEFTGGVGQGELAITMCYWVHSGIGPNNDMITCSAKQYNKPCYVCEYRAALERQKGETDDEREKKALEDRVASLKPKQRQLWNVQDLSGKEPVLYVWDVSDYLFGNHLRDKISLSKESKGYRNFADLRKGFSLSVGAKQQKKGGFTFNEFKSIEFEERSEPLDKSILKEVAALDECVIETSYNDLKALFSSGESDMAKAAAFTEGLTVEFEVDGKELTGEIISVDSKKKIAKVKSGKKTHSVKFADLTIVEDEDDEDDDDAPKGKKKPAKGKKGKKDEDEDEDDDADDDEDDDADDDEDDDSDDDGDDEDAEDEDEDEDDDADDDEDDDDDDDDSDDDDDDASHTDFKKGDFVVHKKHGECEIVKILDKKFVNLEDDESELIKKVPIKELKHLKKKEKKEDKKADKKKKKGKK